MFSIFRRKASPRPEWLTPEEFLARREADAVIVDVRTPGEYQRGHLAGARNIDLQAPNFRQRVDALDRERSYYLYCRSGNRSGIAAAAMRDLGFERVHNIGGLDALARAGCEVER